MRRILFAVPVLASTTALPAEAEMFGPGFQPCGDKTSTPALLSSAYRQKPTWRISGWSAQRLWVQYRDANCGFYGVQDVSIRQVQAAECIRSMTEDRARELEKAMKLD